MANTRAGKPEVLQGLENFEKWPLAVICFEGLPLLVNSLPVYQKHPLKNLLSSMIYYKEFYFNLLSIINLKFVNLIILLIKENKNGIFSSHSACRI